MKHLPTIIIKVVDHKKQRYDTAGDWYKKKGTWTISISKTHFLCELCVAIHELWEMCLCWQHGIKEADVTKFDIESGLEDPGASHCAPYHYEHLQAEQMERCAVMLSGESWDGHNNTLDSLGGKHG